MSEMCLPNSLILNKTHAGGNKTVHQAAETGDLAALKKILDGHSSAIYLKHEIGQATALHYAARFVWADAFVGFFFFSH